MSRFGGGPSPEEMGTKPERQEKATEEINGIKAGDVIDFAGKKVRVRGFTAPKGDPGRAFMVEELKPEELEAYQQRGQIILGKVKHQIEANPNAIVDVEQAKKYWGRLYDEAGNGDRMEMQINEIYAQRYEEMARYARERMLVLEQQLNSAQSEGEKQALLSEIVAERDFAIEMEQEAKNRRSYTNPASKESR